MPARLRRTITKSLSLLRTPPRLIRCYWRSILLKEMQCFCQKVSYSSSFFDISTQNIKTTTFSFFVCVDWFPSTQALNSKKWSRNWSSLIFLFFVLQILLPLETDYNLFEQPLNVKWEITILATLHYWLQQMENRFWFQIWRAN